MKAMFQMSQFRDGVYIAVNQPPFPLLVCSIWMGKQQTFKIINEDIL